LREASLDADGLDDEVLAQLRHPPQEPFDFVDPDLRLALKLFISTTNSSQKTYANIRQDILERHPEDPILSHAAIKRQVALISGVAPVKHDMCPDSCIAYTGPFKDLEMCPTCGEHRFDPIKLASSNGEIKIARQKFYTFPLGPQLQALWRTPKGAERMQYRHQRTTEILEQLEDSNGVIHNFDEFWHGSEYLNAVGRGDISTDDMVLMFSIDGAQLYEHKTSDFWVYIWIILDLPPDLRYKKKHVLIGGFIPGNPKNTDSFLYPGFHHLAALQKEGLQIWDSRNNRIFKSHPFLALGTADGPGSVHFTGLVGHHGAYPCRLYCGIKGRHKPGVPHYYPALLKPDNYTVAECNHPDISVHHIQQGSPTIYKSNLNYLLRSRNITEFKDRRKRTGISKPSLFNGLAARHRLPLPSGFPADLMHLLTLNLGDLLIPLWRGLFTCAETDNIQTWDWAVLKGDVWTDHGAAVARATPYIPGSFDRPPRNPAEKISSGYKAREWLGYLFGLAPALLHGILPDKYWKNFCKLVYAVRILHQRSITLEQLQSAHQHICEFHEEFEHLYCQRRTDRLHFIRPCIHALLHLAPEVARVGPGSLYSQWTMERTIGNIGEEVNQESDPFVNLSERGLRRTQVNALKSIIPGLDHSKDNPHGSMDLGDQYLLLRARDESAHYIDGEAGRLIRVYIEDAEHKLGNVPEDDWEPKITRWARLRLPNGQIARSAWKENQKALKDVRMSRCVKVGSLTFVRLVLKYYSRFVWKIGLALLRSNIISMC
jgi:hypothetical protein